MFRSPNHVGISEKCSAPLGYGFFFLTKTDKEESKERRQEGRGTKKTERKKGKEEKRDGGRIEGRKGGREGKGIEGGKKRMKFFNHYSLGIHLHSYLHFPDNKFHSVPIDNLKGRLCQLSENQS